MKPEEFNWFGKIETRSSIALRYGVSRGTVNHYFRVCRDAGNIEICVLDMINARKAPGNKYKNKMSDVTVGPRRSIESIPSPTRYEKSLWGY